MSEGKRDTFGLFTKNTSPWSQNITTLRGPSREMAKSFGKKIHMLFIDGNHSYEGCHSDLNYWLPHLVDKGVVIFHDYPNAPGVVRAVCEMKEENRLRTDVCRGRCLICHKL